MNSNFIHTLFSSFAIWFDHHLVQAGSGFSNNSGRLYNINDPTYSGVASVYSSPFKQWVYDSSISGSIIPSGVYVNNTFIPRGTSGLILDFQNGRAIFPSGKNNWNVTTAYSSKDLNIYTTTKTDAQLIFETRYMVNPTIPQIITGSTADQVIAPCVFLKLKGYNNVPFAYGGQDTSIINIRALVLADSEFLLNAVGSIFVDTDRSNVIYLDYTPLNRYNDIKFGYYNYVNTVCSGFNFTNLAFIDRVNFVRFNSKDFAEKYPDMYIGFLDFRLLVERYPRGKPEFLVQD